MVISYSSNWKQGKCALCCTQVAHLERHHISYKPEVCIDLCHNCHFLCHYFPNRLPRFAKEILFKKKYAMPHALSLLDLYENNPIMLAKHIAPSRREAIHAAQREELERINKE